MEHGHTAEEIRARFARPAHAGFLREGVYGAIDGAVTTLAIVAGVAGAGLPDPVVLALGIANVLADGFSMAAGAFVALRSERDNVARLRAMEHRHVREVPDGERRELRAILGAKGLEGATLENAIAAISAHEGLWVDLMLTEEHGVSTVDASPLGAALATFGAFVVAGCVPLAPFLLGAPRPLALALVATACVFVGIGSLRGRFSLHSGRRAAAETLAIGATAGAVAWGASVAVRTLTG